MLFKLFRLLIAIRHFIEVLSIGTIASHTIYQSNPAGRSALVR